MRRAGMGLSNTLTPGIARIQAQGARVGVEAYPEGPAGAGKSLDAIAQKIREGQADPDLQGWAADALRAAGFDGRTRKPTVLQLCQAVLDAFCRDVMYASDPAKTEQVQSASATLCLRGKMGLCLRRGDCDDACVVLGSAILSFAIPVRIVKQPFKEQEHVLIAAQDESGGWVYVDGANNRYSAGYPGTPGCPPQVPGEVYVDPMSKAPVGPVGSGGAQLVTLGASPAAPPQSCGGGARQQPGRQVSASRDSAQFGWMTHRGSGSQPSCVACANLPGTRRGFGDSAWPPVVPAPTLPPGNWAVDNNLDIKQGSRYVVTLVANDAFCEFQLPPGACPWQQSDAMAFFAKDWLVETLAKLADLSSQGTIIHGVSYPTYWIMRGVARHDMKLTNVPNGLNPVVINVWQEVPGGGGGSGNGGNGGGGGGGGNIGGGTNQTSPPASPGVSFAWAFGITAGVIAVGAGVYYLARHSDKVTGLVRRVRGRR